MDTVDYLLDEKSPRALQPDSIGIQLKPHQLANLYRMCMIDRDCGMTMKSAGIKVHSNIAILADLSGYGKTIVFLALIDQLRSKDTQWMPQAKMYITQGYGIAVTKKQHNFYIDTSLIVVPDNLVDHWQRHLDNFTELDYETIEIDNFNKIIIEENDLILCPARFYNKFIEVNEEYFWNRVAFDEADSIHIPNTRAVKARFLWLITATFDQIPKRRNRGFLRDLFYTHGDPINNYFFPVVIRGKEAFVKQSFSLIEPDTTIVKCLTPSYIRVVRHYLTPQVLELVNAGDLDAAIIALGGNVDNDRNIIELVTRNIKNDITMAEAKLEAIEKLEITKAVKEKRRETITTKLATLHERKRDLEHSINEVANNDCTICMDTLQHPTLAACCNNIFCAKCLLNWLKSNEICPMCRSNLDPTELQTISTTADSKKRNTKKKHRPTMDKIQTIVHLLKENPEGRFIIFAGYAASLHDISPYLDENHITYGVLTTNLQTTRTLDRFRRGDYQAILLDANYNGAGIEMQQATDVILYHSMRPSMETQAIARAQRPGRVGQLRVWKLCYKHEIN